VAGRFSAPRPLLACRVDLEGGCDPIQVAPDVEDDRIRVSGGRIVWDGFVGQEGGDVFFCEFDPLLGRCPVQRLTSEGSEQGDSDIDGHHVVWIDERLGAGRVAGTTLPGWLAPGRRHARVGRPFTLTAWLDEADHGPMQITVERSDPESLAPSPFDSVRIERAAKLRRSSPVRIRWCPGAEDVGESIWTLVATSASGLSTRVSVAVEVAAAGQNGRGPIGLHRLRSAARDSRVRDRFICE